MAAIALAVSCVKHDKDNTPESRIELVTEIDPSATSKAIFSGTEFESGNTIGLFVYHSETSDANNPATMSKFSLYGERYRNVYAVNTGNSSMPWRFRFEDANSYFDDMFLLNPSEIPAGCQDGLAVLAYAPYIEDVQSIKEIPFVLGGASENMTDLMWALPGTNYKVVPNGSQKQVPLVFKHALSMLKIGFKCSNTNSVMKVTGLTIKKKEGGQTMLVQSGKFDATDGSIDNPAGVQSLKYDYTNEQYSFQYSEDQYVYVPVLICPQEYKADGDYELFFELNGKTLSSSYKIKVNDVAGGFQPGVIYTFKFTFDNYIQFDGASVSTEWIALDENKRELEF